MVDSSEFERTRNRIALALGATYAIGVYTLQLHFMRCGVLEMSLARPFYFVVGALFWLCHTPGIAVAAIAEWALLEHQAIAAQGREGNRRYAARVRSRRQTESVGAGTPEERRLRRERRLNYERLMRRGLLKLRLMEGGRLLLAVVGVAAVWLWLFLAVVSPELVRGRWAPMIFEVVASNTAIVASWILLFDQKQVHSRHRLATTTSAIFIFCSTIWVFQMGSYRFLRREAGGGSPERGVIALSSGVSGEYIILHRSEAGVYGFRVGGDTSRLTFMPSGTIASIEFRSLAGADGDLPKELIGEEVLPWGSRPNYPRAGTLKYRSVVTSTLVLLIMAGFLVFQHRTLFARGEGRS